MQRRSNLCSCKKKPCQKNLGFSGSRNLTSAMPLQGFDQKTSSADQIWSFLFLLIRRLMSCKDSGVMVLGMHQKNI